MDSGIHAGVGQIGPSEMLCNGAQDPELRLDHVVPRRAAEHEARYEPRPVRTDQQLTAHRLQLTQRQPAPGPTTR